MGFQSANENEFHGFGILALEQVWNDFGNSFKGVYRKYQGKSVLTKNWCYK